MVPAVQLVSRAFPDGLGEDDYFALIWALDETGLSIRSIARVIDECGFALWTAAYNDTLGVLADRAQFAEQGQVVLRKLEKAALLEWANAPRES